MTFSKLIRQKLVCEENNSLFYLNETDENEIAVLPLQQLQLQFRSYFCTHSALFLRDTSLPKLINDVNPILQGDSFEENR